MAIKLTCTKAKHPDLTHSATHSADPVTVTWASLTDGVAQSSSQHAIRQLQTGSPWAETAPT